jgi:hypothetical protein
MAQKEWQARTKRELMIEVWEYLDCESVGAKEVEAVREAVRERFGEGAVESPTRVARVLADEGAELRHQEILEMDARWRTQDPYEAAFRNVLKFSTFEEAAQSIRRLDNLRKQFRRKNDREGLRRVQETVLKGKQRAQMIARNQSVNERKREEKAEMAEWFTVWLNQPDIFEDWLALRLTSKDFRERFLEEEQAES